LSIDVEKLSCFTGCADLPTFSYADINYSTTTKNATLNGYAIGTTATVACKSPYKVATKQLSCKLGGIWDDYSCDPTTDTRPPVPGPISRSAGN